MLVQLGFKLLPFHRHFCGFSSCVFRFNILFYRRRLKVKMKIKPSTQSCRFFLYLCSLIGAVASSPLVSLYCCWILLGIQSLSMSCVG